MTKPTLPPLGSPERYEIETIYDRLFNGGFVGFSREPDGRVTWVTISEMSADLDVLPVGGLVDDMEDAKIAAIESILLPSDEGDAHRGP